MSINIPPPKDRLPTLIWRAPDWSKLEIPSTAALEAASKQFGSAAAYMFIDSVWQLVEPTPPPRDTHVTRRQK